MRFTFRSTKSKSTTNSLHSTSSEFVKSDIGVETKVISMKLGYETSNLSRLSWSVDITNESSGSAITMIYIYNNDKLLKSDVFVDMNGSSLYTLKSGWLVDNIVPGEISIRISSTQTVVYVQSASLLLEAVD